MGRGDPIEGQILLLAGTKASINLRRLPELVDRVQATLQPRLESYRRQYEQFLATDAFAVFLVEDGHWVDLGERLDLSEADRDAVRRAHVQQALRAARRADREDELETALEIREAVVIGTGDGEE